MRLNSAFLEILVSGDDVDGLGAIIRGILSLEHGSNELEVVP